MRRVIHLLAPLLGCILLVACSSESPSGDRIVLGVYRGGLLNILNPHHTYAVSTTGSGQIDMRLPGGLGYEAQWSPDGQWIAFIDRSRDYNRPVLSLMKSDGTRRIPINAHPEGVFNPAWSPDGVRLAYFAHGPPSGIYTLNVGCLLRAEDCHPQPSYLIKGEVPAWSPDGKHIVYDLISFPELNRRIFVINAEGTGSPVQLVPELQKCFTPKWSPDGGKIAVSCNGGISVLNSDGSGVLRLTEEKLDYNPQWSPDGSQIAFTSTRYGLGQMIGWEVYSNALFLMNADGSHVIRLSQSDDEAVLWYTWLPSQRANPKR